MLKIRGLGLLFSLKVRESSTEKGTVGYRYQNLGTGTGKNVKGTQP